MRTLDDARQSLRDALDAGDLQRARRAVVGFPALRGPGEALLWAELVWVDRERPDRVAIALTLLEAFPEHGEIVHPCAETALDSLGGFIPGEPPSELAGRVVDAVTRCLASRADYTLEAGSLLRRTLASALARAPVPPERVEAAWDDVLETSPHDGAAWFELALWLKYQGRFRDGLGAALQAARQMGPSDAVAWNVGICATGCGEHAHAEAAWRRLGLAPPPLGTRRWVRVVTTDPVYGHPSAPRVEVDVLVDASGPCDGHVVEAPATLPITLGDRILHDGTPLDAGPDGRPRLPMLAKLS